MTLLATDLIVRKRNGNEVIFDLTKIINAIQKAELSTDRGITEGLAEKIATKIKFSLSCIESAHVETIQDLVEEELMSSDRKDVAKSYIIYREKRNQYRQGKSFDSLTSIVKVESNDVTKENANMNASTPAGMMMKFASETSKQYALSELVDPEHSYLHKKGIFHIHDLDYYPTKSLTCCQHPLDHILNQGFKINHASSRQAKTIHSAAIMACISLETAQNEMHGGQSIPAFDFYMAPFVKKTFLKHLKLACEITGFEYELAKEAPVSEYEYKDVSLLHGIDRVIQHAINQTVSSVHQAMEGFVHNMNSIHSRGGNQVVFSSINYGTDTSPEGRCVIKQLLLSTERGVGKSDTPVFPIQVFKSKEGVNVRHNDPSYDLFKLSCRVTAKRFFPNFLNLDADFNQHEKWDANDPNRYLYEVATMGK